MNKFRTEVIVSKSNFQLSVGSAFLTLGSCFADVIGQRLNQYKFPVSANPFGTVYNPISLYGLLNEELDVNLFLEREGLWLHHNYHSDLRATSKTELTELIVSTNEETLSVLKNVDYLVLTYGTAWVYETTEGGQVVSNCHKVPQKQFHKRLLGMEEMIKAQGSFLDKVFQLNPNIKVLMTVSPVRHIKDGLSESQLSKSMLRVLCDLAVSSHENVSYFPSYEMMVDDLRDYRYYKDDLIHPTDFAQDYIWDKFKEAYFDDRANFFIKEWSKIIAAKHHRPFNPNAISHQNFLKSTLRKVRELSGLVDVTEEVDFFSRQVN